MISSNVFLRFDTFDDEQSVLEFIKKDKEFKANSKTWKEDINKLIRYKKKHLRKYGDENKYRNIYGYYLKVMIPFKMQQRAEEFVKKVMLMIDKRFLRNLYVFKTVKEGQGVYAEIICFTRYVLKRPINRVKKYTRDYYYNSKTKKLCRKDEENAQLKAKKGDPVLDKNGNEIIELAEVKEVEDRIFVYKSIQGLTERLKKAIAIVIRGINNEEFIIRIISRLTVEDDDSQSIRRYKQKRNKEIRNINSIIKRFIDNLILGNLADKEDIEAINEEWCSHIDGLIHVKYCHFNEVEQYLNNWWKEHVLFEMI
jgi:hypothetical protein